MWSSGCPTVDCHKLGWVDSFIFPPESTGQDVVAYHAMWRRIQRLLQNSNRKKCTVTDHTYLLFQHGLRIQLGLSTMMLLFIPSGRQHLRREGLGMGSTWFPSWFCSLSRDSGSGFSVANGSDHNTRGFLYLARLVLGTVQKGFACFNSCGPHKCLAQSIFGIIDGRCFP